MSLFPLEFFNYLQKEAGEFCDRSPALQTSSSLSSWVSWVLTKVQTLVCRSSLITESKTSSDNVFDRFFNPYSTSVFTSYLILILPTLFFVRRYLMNGRSSFSYGGRGSPYTSQLADAAGRSLSGHVEYIGEDHDLYQSSHRPSVAVTDYESYENPNAPDIIHVRHMASILPIEFPPFSISEERAHVRSLRSQVADHFRTDPRRIRLVYKGRDLRHNSWPLRRYQMKQYSEVAVVITESYIDFNESHSSSGDEREPVIATTTTERRQRPRAHSSVRHRSDDSIKVQTNGSFLHPNGYAPSPATDKTRHQSLRPDDNTGRDVRQHSRSSSPAPPQPTATSTADPHSPMGKIQSLASTFHTKWLPDCTKFIINPPPDSQAREKEYRKLSEMIMMQVVLKADDIETEGNADARKFRKNLVDEANEVMKKLDAVMGVKKA